MIASTVHRVQQHTSPEINEQIAQHTAERIEELAGDRDRIASRLQDLDREWDIERALQATSASITLLGLGLAVVHDRRWTILPIAVQLFFMQHTLQGWCPPLPLLRRMGFRTEREIDQEREALRSLRNQAASPAVVTCDPVDQASKDSFPASDPPAYSGSTATPNR